MKGTDAFGSFDPGPGAAALAGAFRLLTDKPSAALERHLDRIFSLGAEIGAVLDLRTQDARREAAEADERWRRGLALSRIDGISFGVKANIAVAGMPWHGGVGAYRDRLAEADAEAVRRLKRAGAIPVAILNMHEGALGATTDNPHFGRCRNPWNVELTPGGSSGGSAAAVAAGFCALALGTDTMGSVRIPSAYCGVVGHKPTRGLAPTGGLIDLSPTLDHLGPHGATVADCRLALSTLAGIGFDADEQGRLRIGVGRWADRVDCEPDVEAAFERSVCRLAQVGNLRDIDLREFDFGALRRRGLLVSEVEGWNVHQAALDARAEGFSLEFRSLLEWGHSQGPDKIEAAYLAVRDAGRRFLAAFEDFDVVVLPTTPQSPFAFTDQVPANQADFTAIANFSGAPATSVPTSGARSGATPPPSVQFIARPGADALSLHSASIFEAIRDD